MNTFNQETGASLKTAFEGIVLDWPKVTSRWMFGYPAYQADGTIFAVLVSEGVTLTRLPTKQQGQLSDKFVVTPFEGNGRTFSDWVQVTIDEGDLASLVPFIEASYEKALAETENKSPPVQRI